MINVFDITEFGAIGDGKTDCTSNIQTALDKAGEVAGVVVVPPGNYLCSYLKVPAGVVFQGYAGWSIRKGGSSVLTLIDDKHPCLIDITNAFGCTIKGLSLDGGRKGENIHGIMLSHKEYNGGGQEDTPTIEDCRVSSFSGNAVHFYRAWCFSVRHSMLCFCGGSGLFIDGWDGFIIDNWFSGNDGAGLLGGKVTSSVTFTGNRIEWNKLGGFCIEHGNSLNITGNYFDRSGGAGLSLCAKDEEKIIDTVSVTGNIFYRSGAGNFENPPKDALDSTHIRLNRCVNMTIGSNSFRMGDNDEHGGPKSPDYTIVMRKLKDCVISANTMYCGSGKKAILDLGEHEGAVEVFKNVGTPPTKIDDVDDMYPSFNKD